MKNKKIIIVLLLIGILLIPTVSAVWWNPFTWRWFQNLIYNPEDKIAGIVDIQQCDTVYWNQTSYTNEIKNLWIEENQTYQDRYITTKIITLKNETNCKNIGININNKEKIMFDDYYCSHDDKTVICDSKNDGNGDGICQSGESCFKIIINDDGKLIKTEKNSNDEFIESDNTFILKRVKMEKLK